MTRAALSLYNNESRLSFGNFPLVFFQRRFFQCRTAAD